MEPEIDRSSFAADLDGQIVREHFGLLMRHAAGLGRRHVGAIADGVDVVPFGLKRVLVNPNPRLGICQPAIEQHLRRAVRRHHYE